jgi:metallo-beta-lactamase family protein
MLHKLFDQNRIPDIPVFVDSPMAVNATEVFRRHPECLDREAQRIYIQENNDPFGYSRLSYIRDVKQSKALNSLNYPHIIISASGMAEGGRILHHLRNNIGNSKNVVLLVGYAARETLARKLRDGQKSVRIFGEEHRVRCRVEHMDDFSAHADRTGLLDFVKTQSPEKLKNIFLVHGEEEQAIPLKNALRSLGFPNVHFPESGNSYEI